MTTPNLGLPEIDVGNLPRGKDYKFNELVTYLDTNLPLLQPLDADLTAIAALTGTGILARTAADTWAQRTITGPAAGLTVTNGDGVAGDPALSLADDLAALEGLAATGIAVRTATSSWAQRTITGTANEIDVVNGNGVSGNPVLSLPAIIELAGKTIRDSSSGIIEFTGNGTGNANTVGWSFRQSDASLSGFIGEASTGNQNLYLISYVSDIRFLCNGTANTDFLMTEATFEPGLTATKSLGTSSLRWTNIHTQAVNFPATQVASADANTLDDYEEGGWTPTVTFATPGDVSVGYSERAGTYVKIGRLVHLEIQLILSSFTHTTASGALIITGKPFACQSRRYRGAAEMKTTMSAGYTWAMFALEGNSDIFAMQCGSTLNNLRGSTANFPSGTAPAFNGAIMYDV